MKRLLFIAFAAVAALSVSCSKDDVADSANEGAVTFSAQLPGEFSSRAMGDGTTATTLSYAVYEAGETTPLIVSEDKDRFSNLQAKISLNLVVGKTYDILFWADAEDSPYTVDFATQTVVVDYEGALSNDEKRDAFFHAEMGLKVEGPVNKAIELKRPFAQLNIGTNDTQEAAATGVAAAKTQVKIKAYGSLNLATGVAADLTDVTYDFAALPTDPSKFAVEGKGEYDYLAMNYVLVNEDSELLDCTFTVNDASDAAIRTMSVTSVPLQRNYRTNIFGALLTHEADFDVVIAPGFDGEHSSEVWDGKTTEEVTPTPEGVYEVTTAAELAWIAAEVNAGNDTFSGKTVKLMNDIDLAGAAWTPIGTSADNAAARFQGTLDGNDKVIRNLYVNRSVGYHAAGLFGALNGTVNNLTIEKAVVRSVSEGGANGATSNGTAVVAGSIYNTGLVENVKVNNAEVYGNRYLGGIAGYVYGSVKNCSVNGITLEAVPDKLTGSYDNGDKVGGIAGYVGEGSSYAITGNTVTGVTIKGYRDLGGIVGCSNIAVSGNTVTGATITVDQKTNSYGPKDANAGAVVGRNLSGQSVADNVSSDVTVTYNVDEFELPAVIEDGMTISGAADGSTVLVLESAASISADNVTIENLTVSGKPLYFRGGNITVKGVEFDNGTEGKESAVYVNGNTCKNVTFEGCEFTDAAWDAIQLTDKDIESVTIKDCVFRNTKQGYRYIHLELTNGNQSFANPDAKVTITGCTFENVSMAYCKDSAITIAGFMFSNMTIENNVVKGVGADNLTTNIIWICDGVDFGALMSVDDIKAKFQYKE